MIEFPLFPRKDIDNYDRKIMNEEYQRKKVKALQREWLREKVMMKELAEDQILQEIEYNLMETEKMLSKLKTVGNLRDLL